MTPNAAVVLYTRMLEAWNRRDASGFAAVFSPVGLAIGFDGSEMEGRTVIERQLADVFAHHQTASYVANVRRIRPVGGEAVLLQAAVGMVPPGGESINPALNALQTVLVEGDGGAARIALLQTTPAAFHGRPHLGEQLTAEVSAVLRRGVVVAAD